MMEINLENPKKMTYIPSMHNSFLKEILSWLENHKMACNHFKLMKMEKKDAYHSSATVESHNSKHTVEIKGGSTPISSKLKK